MRRGCATDIKFVIISWFIGPDPSWRSMANEISRKMTRFSYLFASIMSHTSTKHTPRPFQSIGYIKRRLLIPSLCSSCISMSFNNIIGNLSSRLLKFQHQPPRSIQVPKESPRCAGKPYNFSSLPHLISHLSEDDAEQQWLDGYCPYLPSWR